MAVHLYKAVVVLAAASGKPEDDINNTFYFDSDSAGPSVSDDVDDMQSWLNQFYNDTPSGLTLDLANFMGEQISRASNACSILYYAHPQGDPDGDWGSPVATRNWTLDAAATGTPFPAEVAAVLSFHGDLTDVPETEANPSPPPALIRPASRRRGRVYIGPLQSASGGEDGTTHEITPSTSFRNHLAGAAQELADHVFGVSTDAAWVVASKADGSVYPVVGGWVDYAFDTQRRRGQAAAARQLWP